MSKWHQIEFYIKKFTTQHMQHHVGLVMNNFPEYKSFFFGDLWLALIG